MAKISIQFKPGAFYLEDQALADPNFVWDDYTFLPPVIFPDGRKLFVHRDADVQFETFMSESTDPDLENTDDIVDLIELELLPQLTYNNGNSSGEVDVDDSKLGIVLKLLSGTDPELVTFTVV